MVFIFTIDEHNVLLHLSSYSFFTPVVFFFSFLLQLSRYGNVFTLSLGYYFFFCCFFLSYVRQVVSLVWTSGVLFCDVSLEFLASFCACRLRSRCASQHFLLIVYFCSFSITFDGLINDLVLLTFAILPFTELFMQDKLFNYQSIYHINFSVQSYTEWKMYEWREEESACTGEGGGGARSFCSFVALLFFRPSLHHVTYLTYHLQRGRERLHSEPQAKWLDDSVTRHVSCIIFFSSSRVYLATSLTLQYSRLTEKIFHR